MALPFKLNFRGSLAYVTDGAGETAVIDSTGTSAGAQGEQYPTTRNSITFGWDASTCTTRDRNAVTPPVEFAGMHRNELANRATFRVDLPSTGSYTIRVAAGDYIQAFNTELQFFDDAASLFTITGATSAADKFKDATGTEYSSAAWAGSNTAQTVTMSSTTNGSGGPILYVKIGSGAGLDTGCIAHLEIASAGGAASSFSKPMWPMSYF